MNSMRFAFLSLLLPLLLVACGQSQDNAAPAAAPAAIEQPAADAPAEPAAADDTAPDTDTAADTPAPAPAPAPAAPALRGPPPVAGTHYVEIPNGQPYRPLNGQVEVVEVFGYTCPACASFEPQFTAWKQRQPADVRVTHLPAAFGGFWTPYARAYFAADAMGLAERTHRQMFEAVHLQRSLPVQGVSDDAIAAFYASHGADARRFASTLNSFAVNGQLRRAEQFASRSGVMATPTLVINGKYRLLGEQSFAELLRVAEHLIARERDAAAGD